jgi:hypothetical protein
MKQENLFELIQNSVVGAIALHGFTLGFYNVAKNKETQYKFPDVNYFFYVLPIVFNRDAMETFRGSNELYSVLLKNKSIALGLHERALKMTPQTFDSLNIAFTKKVLTYDRENRAIQTLKPFHSKKLPLPLAMSNSENSVKKIQDCAFKLGAIFAKRNSKNIEFELNIKL